jgi:putative transposase
VFGLESAGLRVRKLRAEHPFWAIAGCGRICATSTASSSTKTVYGVMKANDLLVRPNPKLRARRKADTRKPRPTRPNQWWGIDMTKVIDPHSGATG